jgi:hypothetical protein
MDGALDRFVAAIRAVIPDDSQDAKKADEIFRDKFFGLRDPRAQVHLLNTGGSQDEWWKSLNLIGALYYFAHWTTVYKHANVPGRHSNIGRLVDAYRALLDDLRDMELSADVETTLDQIHGHFFGQQEERVPLRELVVD